MNYFKYFDKFSKYQNKSFANIYKFHHNNINYFNYIRNSQIYNKWTTRNDIKKIKHHNEYYK